jgi:hypothetical protein
MLLRTETHGTNVLTIRFTKMSPRLRESNTKYPPWVIGRLVVQAIFTDTLNATNRLADNTHLNDTGAAAAALLVYNAMHASGAPL